MNTVWLLTEIDPEDADMVFGLEDSGHGSHKMRYISLTELESRFAQQSVRRDKDFQTDEPLSKFVERTRGGVAGWVIQWAFDLTKIPGSDPNKDPRPKERGISE